MARKESMSVWFVMEVRGLEWSSVDVWFAFGSEVKRLGLEERTRPRPRDGRVVF